MLPGPRDVPPGAGGATGDLDGDGLQEPVLIMRRAGEIRLLVLPTRALARLREDTPLGRVRRLELRATGEREEPVAIDRVEDCDGDGRRDVVVDTSASRCPAGSSTCDGDFGGAVRRRYVLSRRTARTGGLVTLGSAAAPRARTVREPG